MQEKKSSSRNIGIIVLAVLLIAIVAYMLYSNNEHKKLTDAISEEKQEIAENLDSMIVKYEDAIAQNTSISNELSFERDRIMALRDSVKDLKISNYRLLRMYRQEIGELEDTNRKLFKLNDSLVGANKGLTKELDSATEAISIQVAKNDSLFMQNQELVKKVAIGAVLKAEKAVLMAMRERSSGKLTETSRSRYTDAFRINFTIEKNEIATQGERNVYVQIVNAAGATVAATGELAINDELNVNYSDKTTVNYMNEDIDIISLVEVERKSLSKGIYTVNIFIENKFAGSSSLTLK